MNYSYEKVRKQLSKELRNVIETMRNTEIVADNKDGFSYFIQFKNPKGYWVVWMNENTVAMGKPLRMFQLKSPISFEAVKDSGLPFCTACCRICRESSDLIVTYSAAFSVKELPHYIEAA